MSIVGFLSDRQADILIGNEAHPSYSTLLQSLGFLSVLVSWQNEQHPVSKNNVSPLKRWWTRTQRIRTEAELPFAATLADTTAAPRYQRIALKALHLHQLGLGSTTIARRLGTTRKTVIKALAWLARSRQVE